MEQLDPTEQLEALVGSNEISLIMKIGRATSELEREQLITELEKSPVVMLPFHARWVAINGGLLAGWSDTGYESDESLAPRDVQILAAVHYGMADIENGGFHQFFTNSTGVFAPEMMEWFKRVGFDDTAKIMQEAIAKFGDVFPRSRAERNMFLDSFENHGSEFSDPFNALNERFFDSISRKDGLYDEAADKWLREQCKVTNLRQKI